MPQETDKMRDHLMIVPSLACPASCKYCFGPHEGGKMSLDVVKSTVKWQQQYSDKLELTFHGGEPLAAGADFYKKVLPLLTNGLSRRKVNFSIQSNLWLLTDELCQIFRQHKVSIGTSLDGPEHITDSQRGAGYFKRTMKGIDLARSCGLDVGCICTFTPQSLLHLNEIFDFFIKEGLNFSIHASMPSLRYPDVEQWVLQPQAHSELLTKALDLYLNNLSRIRIGTLDSLCKSVATRHGGICTFGDCLGGYLAVGPDGSIYPCQRFAGIQEYVLGNVMDTPSDEDLHSSRVWQMFQNRQVNIGEECGECSYLDICRGGCPYNVLAAYGGNFTNSLRDPHCLAYKDIFQLITDRALEEVFSEENMQEVIERVDEKAGLLRRGKLLSIMREGPHPYETSKHAKRILASVALASTNSASGATISLKKIGVLPDGERSDVAMEAFYKRLNAPTSGLNNLYLHVTFDCNLRCTHCYADAGARKMDPLPVDEIIQACREAAKLGFRHTVITGGEPLIHPERDRLLDALAAIRKEIKPMLIVLRTNLAVEADDLLLNRIGNSTDEVVVSVDGDRETHDSRRGKGSYDLTLCNLRALKNMGYDTDLSIATVLPLRLANGKPGNSVRSLAQELGIKRTRFKPILPIGRAGDFESDVVPETIWEHMDPREIVEYGFSPTSSCGIGQNLYVEPDGKTYPCYAWHGHQWYLGSIIADGLKVVINSDKFRELGKHTVNTNHRCSGCQLRYLCGGACRAWNQQAVGLQMDLDASPLDCSTLHTRARSLFKSALECLSISEEMWLVAGLSLP